MKHLDFYELLEQDQHDPEVQYQLGLRYWHGDGTVKDGQEALRWLQLAAEQGHGQALALLNGPAPEKMDGPISGDNLPDWCARAEDGDADAQFAVADYLLQTAPDENQYDIERYLREAADQGHAQACLTLGKKLLDDEDHAPAVFYLERACECSIGEAAELLSRCYYYGNGVPMDDDKAAQFLERASDWGDAQMKLRIALRYALGDDIFISQARAMAYLAKAQKAGMENARAVFDAQLEAHRQAQLAEEESPLNAFDPGENLPDWCARAEGGDADAQFTVATYLMQTDPDGNQGDIDRYLRDAADQGHAQACLTVGRKMLDEEDYGPAVFYLKQACKHSIGEAAELLSSCYYYGNGVGKDDEKAAQFLDRAFDWGNADRKLNVALRFALGEDIFPSQVKALAYVAKAQKAGVEDARTEFDTRLEARRQAEKARAEAQRQREEAQRLRQEQEAEAARLAQQAQEARLTREAEGARLAQEKKAYLGKVLEAAEKLRLDVEAKETRLAREKEAHLEKVYEEGSRVLQLVRLKTRLARLLLFPGSLIAAAAAFAVAFLCSAPFVQAVLLSLGFAAAAVLVAGFLRKGIAQPNVQELAHCLEEVRQSRNDREKER